MTTCKYTCDIGQFNEKIIIQKPTDVKKSTGENVPTWATFYTAFAQRIYRSGKEGNEGDQEVALNRVKFKVYYKAAVTERMRVKDAANVLYDIVHIEIVGMNQFLILTAEKPVFRFNRKL